MATDDIERLNYYQRQYLGALDFEDQQAYHRDMRRRLNLAHHTWGIVTGLELQDTNTKAGQPTDIYINPGMAIDGYGREIVMFTPTQLDVSLFQHYRTITRKWTICLKYYENLSQRPQSGYEQYGVPNQFGRVQENFRIVLAIPYTFRDDLSVAGNHVQAPALLQDPNVPNLFPEDQPIQPLSPPTGASNLVIPYDESLPYQEFPLDDPSTLQFARWLIPLGDVKWDGTLQSLVHDDSDPSIHANGRHYVGAVASRLLAPARTLIVRDRSATTTLPFKTSIQLKNQPSTPTPPSPPVPDGVEMFVEGTLEVDRTLQVDGILYAKDDIQLDGGKLDFRDASGDSDSTGGTDPLFTISRRGPGSTGGIDLRLQIGKDQAGKNHFVVGTTSKDLFTIGDNGVAHLAGSMDGLSISGTLDFGSQPRQMITLWTSQDVSKPNAQNGIGIQAGGGPPPTSATTYFRSSNDFYWYKGGTHSDVPGDPGGGTWLMKLDESGGLDVNGSLFVNGGLNFNGPLLVTGNLDVKGPVDITGNLDVKGPVDITGKLDVKGPVDITGNLDVKGLLVVNGPSLSFQSTTNAGFFVNLGQVVSPHASDSIYGSPNLWLDAAGAVIVKQGLRISQLNGAAFFDIGAPAPNSGDVVVLDAGGKVIQSSTADNTSVVGVAMDWHASVPGFILADQPNPQKETTSIVVALMGIVQCNVDAASGAINPGDLLKTSNNPGHAQKADPTTTPRGAVFAKALEQKLLGTGTIKVLIMPS